MNNYEYKYKKYKLKYLNIKNKIGGSDNNSFVIDDNNSFVRDGIKYFIRIKIKASVKIVDKNNVLNDKEDFEEKTFEICDNGQDIVIRIGHSIYDVYFANQNDAHPEDIIKARIPHKINNNLLGEPIFHFKHSNNSSQTVLFKHNNFEVININNLDGLKNRLLHSLYVKFNNIDLQTNKNIPITIIEKLEEYNKYRDLYHEISNKYEELKSKYSNVSDFISPNIKSYSHGLNIDINMYIQDLINFYFFGVSVTDEKKNEMIYKFNTLHKIYTEDIVNMLKNKN